MTVCVAALAKFSVAQEDGTVVDQPIVIFASDRMITVGQKREYEMASQTKMFPLSNHISVLISGSGELLLEICQRTWETVQENAITSVREVTELLRRNFAEYRNERIEATVLNPRDLNWTTFYLQQANLAPSFRDQLLQEIDSYDRDLGMLLLAGVDEEGAHLVVVADPGEIHPRNQSGYAAIGIGAEFAEAEFMARGYTPYFRWEYSLWLTYAAKKRAEVASGVGELTDLYWITPAGRAQFGPGTDFEKGLSELFKKREQAEALATLADTQELMKIWGALNATPGAQQSGAFIDHEPMAGGLEEGQPASHE